MNVVVVLELLALWKSRMTIRHADAFVKSPRDCFLQIVNQVHSVYLSMKCTPEWTNIFEQVYKL